MRLKFILQGIISFIQSLLLLFLTISIVMLLTLFNPNYIKDNLEKNKYYDTLNTAIKDEMLNNIIQSGLEESVLTDIYSVYDIKKDTLNIVNRLFYNKNFEIDVTSISNKLNTNIDNYLLKYNIEVDDQESMDKFVGQMTNIYKNSVGYSNIINKYGHFFNKAFNYLKLGTIVIGILLILNLIISKTLVKTINLSVPLFTCSILLLFSYLYIKNSVDIANFIFYTIEVSSLLRTIFVTIFKYILYVGITYLIIGILFALILNKSNFKKEKTKAKLFILLAWLIIIIGFSSQNGISSSKTSSNVVKTTVEVINVFTTNDINDNQVSDIINNKISLIRKCAHFTEYLILGLLLIDILCDYYKKDKKLIIFCIMLCFIYACIDELYQTIIPNRMSSFKDVLIDASGSTLGIILYSLFKKTKKKKLIT